MTHNFKTIVTLVFSILSSVTAGKFDAAVRAFQSQPDYVKPAATLLGSFGGSGWTHRSSIKNSFICISYLNNIGVVWLSYG